MKQDPFLDSKKQATDLLDQYIANVSNFPLKLQYIVSIQQATADNSRRAVAALRSQEDSVSTATHPLLPKRIGIPHPFQKCIQNQP